MSAFSEWAADRYPDGLPELPYAGSSGWSGSDTSKARADDADTTGKTTRRQREALAVLREAAEHGATWKEAGAVLGLHHGQISGTLTVLHKTGRVARLGNSRGGCAVYVLPEYVHGRVTKPYTPNGRKPRACPHCGEAL